MPRPRASLIALTAFFALGAVIASLTGIALSTPGSVLESLWRLNPPGHAAFQAMGAWAIALMVAVAAACGLAALGLWVRAWWGHRLAVVLLVLNLVGDATNALVRGDLRTLIGLPIAGALLAYLLSSGVRASLGRGRPQPNLRLKLSARSFKGSIMFVPIQPARRSLSAIR
jgi:hypothetical protein